MTNAKARSLINYSGVAFALTGAALAASSVAAAADEPPRRVVSLNVCTDQLAMMLAAPGQIIALSPLARDPDYSVMHQAAQGYSVTHGLAEEVFLLEPDLVLAGVWSTRATVLMLRRLGIPVTEFTPAQSFDEIRANLMKMGAALGREAQAEAVAAAFDTELKALRREPGPGAPRAALHFANSYTSGSGTLMHEIVTAAGLINIAAERGLAGAMKLPLEELVMASPDLVIGGDAPDAPARAHEIFKHPALRAVAARSGQALVAGADTGCGAPFTLDAVRSLAAARAALEQ